MKNARKRGETTIDCVPSANALYLFIRNTVSPSAEQAITEMIQKATQGELKGIRQIQDAVDELNRLHKAQLKKGSSFGQWGFAILFEGNVLDTPDRFERGEDSYAFRAGAAMDEASTICRDHGWCKDMVVAAFRLPLELPSRLGDPSLKPLAGNNQSDGAKI